MEINLMPMKKFLFETENNWSSLALRLTLGIVLFPHGAQKMLGWFGGYGFTGTMTFFTDSMQLPWIVGFLVIVIEFVGAISLVVGFATRAWSISVIVLMIGIIISSHLPFGFFMNWSGSQTGEGYEYHLLMIGMAIALFLSGGGSFSFDKRISASL